MEVLEEIIAAFPGFVNDEDVNGGDLVDFVGGMIERYEQNRPRSGKCGQCHATGETGTTCRECGRGVFE